MEFAARIDASIDHAGGAFERLFHAEYGRVAAIARRILADDHAAEDVAQDVFVSFHRLHAADAPFASKWLHVAAAHAALNELRGRKRRVRREFADAAASRPVAAVDDPVELVAASDSASALRRALGRIGTRYATVLAMRYAGLSYAEIASAAGVSANQVGTMLRRAEAALKKEFRHGSS